MLAMTPSICVSVRRRRRIDGSAINSKITQMQRMWKSLKRRYASVLRSPKSLYAT